MLAVRHIVLKFDLVNAFYDQGTTSWRHIYHLSSEVNLPVPLSTCK